MKAVALLLGLAALSGCASIVDGSHQIVSLKTVAGAKDVAGSQCTLTNNDGTWFVTSPGSVSVHRNFDPIAIKCEHDGYIAAQTTTNSSTKALVFGNILFGGLIGAGVDMGTGAAYDYPTLIVVPLQPAAIASEKTSPTS